MVLLTINDIQTFFESGLVLINLNRNLF